ncbi:twitching motility protein PilT [Planctomycetales bacterium]|nr:twitching motility protein PilT [Planctomycetales bacterium]
MKILLDSHTFLWHMFGDSRLPVTLQQRIRQPGNTIAVSIVSLWEIAIKIQIGKLELADTLENIILDANNRGLNVLMVRPEHILRMLNLPLFHRDPFDRMIITQGIVDDWTVASIDSNFPKYNVSLIWE